MRPNGLIHEHAEFESSPIGPRTYSALADMAFDDLGSDSPARVAPRTPVTTVFGAQLASLDRNANVFGAELDMPDPRFRFPLCAYLTALLCFELKPDKRNIIRHDIAADW